MILADEGFNGNMVRALREDGYEIAWIKETNAGMDDEDIIKLASIKKVDTLEIPPFHRHFLCFWAVI